jgi:ribosomal protein S13
MIDHLATLLENFPGQANRTCCFTHILNLVAKCIMKQFDEPKKKNIGKMEDTELEEADDLAAALDDLEEELEDNVNECLEMDWENNMRANMTTEEVQELEESVKPVRCVLGKVS